MKRNLIYAGALALIIFGYYYAIKNYRKVEKKPEQKLIFGISEFEDIYTDTIDLKLYTKHGRLK